MALSTIILFLCMRTVFPQQDDNYTEVFVTTGRIRGRLQLVQEAGATGASPDKFGLVSYFLGIPYARPPVGELRFRRTELPEPWEGTLVVDKMPPACPQYSKYPFPWYDTDPGQSEDCLYLNVWAPAFPRTNKKRAVKFYIHGGGWFTGGSNRMGYYDGIGDAYDSPKADFLKKFQGVVVVTVNYRLGALGFLSSGTEDAPGNVGLYDLVTALQWVHDNIAAIGGDPNNVALVGQGSGAIAASLFLIIPRTMGLFNKMVLNGASLYTLKALKKGPRGEDEYDNNIRLAGKLAKAVGCKSHIKAQPEDTVQCLRGVDASRLVQVLASFSDVDQQPPHVFLPQFGHDDLVSSDPFTSFERNDKVDVFLGFNSDEGSHLLTTNDPKDFGVFGEKSAGIDARRAKVVLMRFLDDYPESVVNELLGELDKKSSLANRKKLYQVMGDAYAICPIIYFAEQVVKDGYNVYVLEKKVDPPYNPWADWMGSVHFNNVQFDFVHRDGTLLLNGNSYNYTREQRRLSFVNKMLVTAFMYSEDLRINRFTTEERMHSILQENGHIDDGPKSTLRRRSCEILRPYFVK